MNDLVFINSDGKLVANSKEVADRFGKVHRNVMRDIAGLHCSDEFRALNFEQSSYTSPQNKVLPCIEMTRDGFCFLAMGFTGKEAGKWKEAYISAFNAMEQHIRESEKPQQSVMQALNEAISMMEKDKQIASTFGTGLANWRKIRQSHMQQVEKLHADVQMLLNFK